MASPGRIRMRRPGTPGPRGGGVFVTEVQRARLLDATAAVVSELGYKQMTVRRVSGRAGVSNKTFYDLFENREDCFLAAFDQAVERLAAVVVPAWEGEKEWVACVRAALGALLAFLDYELALHRLVFVEALAAGSRVLERRAEVLEVLQGAVDEGREGMQDGRELPPLTGEGIVGAAFGVIHARLLQSQPAPLSELLNPLTATIVLPYRGHDAAEQELARTAKPALTHASPRHGTRPPAQPVGARSQFADFRPTQRTQMVLAAIAAHPGANNREIADAAEITDQGQISKLLSRLEGVGLIENTGGETQGIPRAWRLTLHGEQTLGAGNAQSAPVGVLGAVPRSSTGNPHSKNGEAASNSSTQPTARRADRP
jgi:AcrR family transcriptional regulator